MNTTTHNAFGREKHFRVLSLVPPARRASALIFVQIILFNKISCAVSSFTYLFQKSSKMPGYTRTYHYTVERHPKDEEAAVYWPYRTTPLVLPGAKVKKDAPLGECYLRHHPNPMIRAAPHHYEVAHPEVAMKQKVAESVLQRVLGPNEVPKVVHKQFNSPIGLYSDQNIADTIKCQTTAIPAVKPVNKYDPSKSEAYKALQEEEMGNDIHEVNQPMRAALFAPQKAHHHRQVHAPPKSPAGSHVSGYDDDGEKIHQSNSFKRIMYSVLGQTDY